MSKSIGNVIYADDLSLPVLYGSSPFYLLSEMPYVQDGSITYEMSLQDITLNWQTHWAIW